MAVAGFAYRRGPAFINHMLQGRNNQHLVGFDAEATHGVPAPDLCAQEKPRRSGAYSTRKEGLGGLGLPGLADVPNSR
jgi:hypothetical protein